MTTYTINACLEQGRPRLQIQDAQSGRVCLNWILPDENCLLDCGQCCEDEHTCPAKLGLHHLFRQLFLLSYASQLDDVDVVLSNTASPCPYANVSMMPAYKAQTMGAVATRFGTEKSYPND